jgi:hypothetical protein
MIFFFCFNGETVRVNPCGFVVKNEKRNRGLHEMSQMHDYLSASAPLR